MEFGEVNLDGIFNSEVQCIANEGMPYGHLAQSRNGLGKKGKVVQVEVMSCVYF
jgi:hypothetical protein